MSLKLLVPPPLVAIAFCAMAWLAARALPVMAVGFETARGPLALALVALAVTIDVSAIWVFWRAKTTVNPLSPERATAIVRSGPYRFSRNPMYAGMALLVSAWVCFLGQPLNVLLIGGFVAYLTVFQIKPEEDILKQKFGAEFEAYLAEVRRWI